MISIDTDVMKQLVHTTASVNEAIDVAVDALNKITVHNDWGCKEKNSINNYTTSNKNKIKNLQENSRAFLNVLSGVSADFETTENNIKDLFQGVEGLLSKIFSVPGIGSRPHTGTPLPKVDLPELPTGHIPFEPKILGELTITDDGKIKIIPLDQINIFKGPSILDSVFDVVGGEDAPNPYRDIPTLFDKFEFTNLFENIPLCDNIPDFQFINVIAPFPDISNISFLE